MRDEAGLRRNNTSRKTLVEMGGGGGRRRVKGDSSLKPQQPEIGGH
jgi:hypothetical protein